jgi:lantibiotic modifying enzyme
LPIGAATGLGSVAYSTAVAGSLLDEPELFEHARRCVHRLMEARGRDSDFDVSAGLAGAIVALLAVHARIGGDALVTGAEAFAGRLLTGDKDDRPACIADAGTGLAHGAAGIALAFARLHAASGRARWRRAARALLSYERSVFDATEGNWPDLRPARLARGHGFLVGWCGGAPGIALGRLDCRDLDHRADDDVAAGVAATLAAPLGIRDHVCCGNMGRVEILFELGRRLNRPELVAAALDRAAQLVARAEQAGTFTLVSDPAIQIAHPGFHQGLSGIGYALLRLVEPDAVPCVLTWS